jgi:hypothetical protein
MALTGVQVGRLVVGFCLFPENQTIGKEVWAEQ